MNAVMEEQRVLREKAQAREQVRGGVDGVSGGVGDVGGVSGVSGVRGVDGVDGGKELFRVRV